MFDEALRVDRFVGYSIYGNNNIVQVITPGRSINALHVDPFDGVDERNNDLKH